MFAKQAIYTSARTGRIRGYQLVAQSPGIDAQQQRSLVRWCPSHGSLASELPSAFSLNFHPVTPGWVALSRTAYGGPEYSGRGSLEIVTRILLLRCDELAGYEYDPATLAQVALALGLLRLESFTGDSLPDVELPDRPLRAAPAHGSSNCPCPEITGRIEKGERIAVIGAAEPWQCLRQIFGCLPVRQRMEVSFTTGLKPSLHRRFHIHFLPSADLGLRQQLAGQRINPIQWQSVSSFVHSECVNV